MNHKNLEVWNRSVTLIKKVYVSTSALPDSERFGLTMQMRKAAISIISNIAEGAARGSDKVLVQFLYQSLGSAAELETQIIISKELEYISDVSELDALIQEIKQMLVGWIKYLKSKPTH